MPEAVQHAFHAGEWAPALNARVDLAKYHSAAALLRNYFVDYRGGASSRPGSRYVLSGNSIARIRLIPFQLTSTGGYIIEFGDQYIRFYYGGAPILETAQVVTGTVLSNPAVVNVANAYAAGDVVYITGIDGTIQLNNRYFKLSAATGATITLSNLRNSAIDATGYSGYVSSGTVQRVYKIASPYAASELSQLRFVKNGNTLYIDHPNHPPYGLTITSSANWALTTTTFGSTVSTPTGGAVVTTLAAGAVHYGYIVTAVDSSGQESSPTAPIKLDSFQDLRTVAGTNTISWTVVTGAVSYNVYKSELSYAAAIPSGSAYGFVGNVSGVSFIDSNIAPDFSQTPPIANNPFTGSGISGITVTAGGSYTTVPTITLGAPGLGGTQATAQAVMSATNVTVFAGGTGYQVGDQITLPSGIVVIPSSIGADGIITSIVILSLGSATTSIPTNPVSQISADRGVGAGASFTITWTVSSVQILIPGSGYGAPPTVTFSSGAATATSTVGSSPLGNPSVPGIFDQRLIHAAPSGSGLAFFGSQPGAFTNYNYSSPLQADDAIIASLVSDQVTTIKAMVPMPSGLLMFTDKTITQLNGGSPGSPITAIDIATNPQSYVGISDIPPIVANKNILFVQQKGSIVRDLEYNFYANIYTGTDISVLSSHLFFGYQLTEWAWAEEPFKIVWAVRNDGQMLSLTYLKEQELIGWAHHDTQGTFLSVATVTENVNGNIVDAVYVAVLRTVAGVTYPYIERLDDRYWFNHYTPWCVDAGLQYLGAGATTFRGLDHLAGLAITGLANGQVIPPTVVTSDGVVTLATAASTVTIGLSFRPQLQTLPLDVGEPTVQGKRKSIDAISVKVANALGLSIGGEESAVVPMKGLVLGQLNEYLNTTVTDLVTADARTISDPNWDIPGQIFIDQPTPYPATILGVIPEFEVGDDWKKT